MGRSCLSNVWQFRGAGLRASAVHILVVRQEDGNVRQVLHAVPQGETTQYQVIMP